MEENENTENKQKTNNQEIDRMLEEEKEKNKKIQVDIERRKNLEMLNELQKEKEMKKSENEKAQKETLVRLSEELKMINELRKNGDSVKKMHVGEDDLFITVEDHKEINPLYIEMGLLKFINLSYVTFENVNVEGIDFRGCNDIGINPQLVYKKSLRNCNMEGIYISPFKDFTEVDIRGCKFSDDNNPKTIDRMNTTLDDAIYDETTTYNGVSFTKIYGECEHKKNKKN